MFIKSVCFGNRFNSSVLHTIILTKLLHCAYSYIYMYHTISAFLMQMSLFGSLKLSLTHVYVYGQDFCLSEKSGWLRRRLRTIKFPCIASYTEHAHHIHLAYKFIHSLCRDMLTQQVEVGCVGIVQFLWRTCVNSERAQPPLGWLHGRNNTLYKYIKYIHVHVQDFT